MKKLLPVACTLVVVAAGISAYVWFHSSATPTRAAYDLTSYVYFGTGVQGENSGIYKFDPTSGTTVRVVDLSGLYPDGWHWSLRADVSPDGTKIAYAKPTPNWQPQNALSTPFIYDDTAHMSVPVPGVPVVNDLSRTFVWERDSRHLLVLIGDTNNNGPYKTYRVDAQTGAVVGTETLNKIPGAYDWHGYNPLPAAFKPYLPTKSVDGCDLYPGLIATTTSQVSFVILGIYMDYPSISYLPLGCAVMPPEAGYYRFQEANGKITAQHIPQISPVDFILYPNPGV